MEKVNDFLCQDEHLTEKQEETVNSVIKEYECMFDIETVKNFVADKSETIFDDRQRLISHIKQNKARVERNLSEAMR